MLPDLDIPTEHLRAIGEALTEWNRLDGILDIAITRLVSKRWDDPKLFILLSSTPFPAKLDALTAIIRLDSVRPGDTRYFDYFERDVLSVLRGCNNQRNAIVHAKWSHDGKHVTKTFLSAKGGTLSIKKRRTSIKEIENTSSDFRKASNLLYKMLTLTDV